MLVTSPSLFLSPSGVLGPQVEELPVRTESGQYSPCLSAARDPSCLCRAIAEMMNERGRGLIRSSDSSGSGGKKGREGDLKKKKEKVSFGFQDLGPFVLVTPLLCPFHRP